MGESLFTLAASECFETVSRYEIDRTYWALLNEIFSARDWHIQREGIWLFCTPRVPDRRRDYVTQGFKIHVSSSPSCAQRTLQVVAAHCAAANIEFKVAADPFLLELLNSKQFPRGNAGKFMTIYPADLDQFYVTVKELHERTRDQDLTGPYILSDRRYRDSRVLYYRYGGFRPIRHLRIDGTSSLDLVDPEGEPAADERLPYFRLPSWVSDPFASEEDSSGVDSMSLLERYAIESAIYFSNSGGVYKATDVFTGAEVVVKEARPGTNFWAVAGTERDATFFLRREFTTLRRLEGIPGVPRALDLFAASEHLFLVEEMVNGVTLESHFAQEDRILAPYLHHGTRIEPFLEAFVPVAIQFVGILRAVHARGIILGDLSPRNILIEPATGKIGLIDFESAVRVDEIAELGRHALAWATPGFMDEGRLHAAREPTFHDDVFALGRVLLSLVVPVNQFLIIAPGAHTRFLDAMVQCGLPDAVPEALSALELGDLGQAEARLAELATTLGR